jgi:DNA-binding beta-propeller fold protein YncE
LASLIEDIEVVGGASPNSIAVGKKYAYISNATNDNISVIDYATQKISTPNTYQSKCNN